jgi:hypothetical protein
MLAGVEEASLADQGALLGLVAQVAGSLVKVAMPMVLLAQLTQVAELAEVVLILLTMVVQVDRA